MTKKPWRFTSKFCQQRATWLQDKLIIIMALIFMYENGNTADVENTKTIMEQVIRLNYYTIHI